MDAELIYLLAQNTVAPIHAPLARMTYLSTGTYPTISGAFNIPYNTVTFSANGASTTTGSSAGITVPITGYYTVNAGVGLTGSTSGAQTAVTSNTQAVLYIYVGGVQYTSGARGSVNAGDNNLSINDTVFAAAGSVIQIKVAGSSQNIYGGNGSEPTTFFAVTYTSS